MKTKNAFTLIEILIGAGIFVIVASISTAIFGYTIYSRNKTNQQNQINQTAKEFFDEIGNHLRSSNPNQKILICGTENFTNNQNDNIGGDLLGHRKIGTELRVFYTDTSNGYGYYANDNNNLVKTPISGAQNCNNPLTGGISINPSDVLLSNYQGAPLQPNITKPYLAFVGCDSFMTDPFHCDGYGPIVRVMLGLESGKEVGNLASKVTSSVFQTTFTSRR